MIASKLNYLAETKRRIRQAIHSKDVPVDEAATFRSYADRILAIEGEGGGTTPPIDPPAVEPLDPQEVYRDTRPQDWMPMPEVVNENEIYLLFHATAPAENFVAFTIGTQDQAPYTVEYGVVVDGVFRVLGGETVAGGEPYHGTFLYGETTGVYTGDGLEQIMLRVSGESIAHFTMAVHPARNNIGCKSWNIMEFCGHCPNLMKLTMDGGNISNRLEYFGLYGNNQISDFSSTFKNCSFLVSVLQLDTANGTSFTNMFGYCDSLTAIPQLDTANGSRFGNMFHGCLSLTTIPKLNTANGIYLQGMFSSCSSLRAIPQLDVSNNTNFNSMFSGCSSLKTIPLLNTRNGTDFASMFNRCSSLSAIPQLDVSNGTNFYGMFYMCSSLIVLPQLNTRNGTDFTGMLYACTALTTILQLDTSNGTNFNSIFYGCSSLTEIPQLDTTNGISFSKMFYMCSSLTAIPYLNTTNGIYFDSMFYNCSSLATIPQLDTINGTNFVSMFVGCISLTTIPQLDTANNANLNEMFINCLSLTRIVLVSAASSASTFRYCPSLSSLILSGSVWNTALDLAATSLTRHATLSLFNDLPTLTTPQTINLQNTPAALTLTPEDIAIAEAKNWTVAI